MEGNLFTISEIASIDHHYYVVVIKLMWPDSFLWFKDLHPKTGPHRDSLLSSHDTTVHARVVADCLLLPNIWGMQKAIQFILDIWRYGEHITSWLYINTENSHVKVKSSLGKNYSHKNQVAQKLTLAIGWNWVIKRTWNNRNEKKYIFLEWFWGINDSVYMNLLAHSLRQLC